MENKFSAVYHSTNDLVTIKTKMVKLEIYERVTNLITSAISSVVIGVFALIAFLFLNMALGFWLSSLFSSAALGFLCLGGFYLLLLFVFLAMRKRFEDKKIKNVILEKVSKTYTDYDELLADQLAVQQEAEDSKNKLSEDFNALKEAIFPSSEPEGKSTNHPVMRTVVTSAIELIFQHVILRKAGPLGKSIIPAIVNTFLTSKLFDEKPGDSLMNNLKLKISKLLD